MVKVVATRSSPPTYSTGITWSTRRRSAGKDWGSAIAGHLSHTLSAVRIAYVCHWDLDSRDGVATKIDSQLARWRAAGHEVTAFSLTPGQTSPSDRDGIRAFPYASVGRRRATRELVRALSEWRPDVVYVRYDLFLPPVWAALGRFVTVLERNGNDRAEAKIRVARARLAALYNALNRRSMMRVANGVVCVTRELAEMTAHSAKHVPVEVIGNGVDLDAIRPLEPATTERPAAAFLGSMRQVWHGVDKLAWLAEALPTSTSRSSVTTSIGCVKRLVVRFLPTCTRTASCT